MCARNIDWPTSKVTKQCLVLLRTRQEGIHYVNENKNFDGLPSMSNRQIVVEFNLHFFKALINGQSKRWCCYSHPRFWQIDPAKSWHPPERLFCLKRGNNLLFTLHLMCFVPPQDPSLKFQQKKSNSSMEISTPLAWRIPITFWAPFYESFFEPSTNMVSTLTVVLGSLSDILVSNVNDQHFCVEKRRWCHFTFWSWNWSWLLLGRQDCKCSVR